MAKVYIFDSKIIENNEANTKLLIDSINEKVLEINTKKSYIYASILNCGITNTYTIGIDMANVCGEYPSNNIRILIPNNIGFRSNILTIRLCDTSEFSDNRIKGKVIVEPSVFIKNITDTCDDIFSNVQRYADELIQNEKKSESFEEFSSRGING